MPYESSVTVRCCETDYLGHVNNTSYFIYLEEARMKFFDKAGYGTGGQQGFILASTKCDFHAQAYFNQTLKVTTAVSRIGVKSFQLNHHILDEKTGSHIATGEAVIVTFNFGTQQSEPIAQLLKSELEKHLMVG